MRPKKHKTTGSNDLFRARLDQIINLKHELVLLAGKVDWDWIDDEIAPLYGENGRPAIETRFVIGLSLLKHIYGLSDEGVCERWVHDPYFQFFTGKEFFQHAFPHERSDLSHWRKRIGATSWSCYWPRARGWRTRPARCAARTSSGSRSIPRCSRRPSPFRPMPSCCMRYQGAQPPGEAARRQAAAILFSRGQGGRDDGGPLRPYQTVQRISGSCVSCAGGSAGSSATSAAGSRDSRHWSRHSPSRLAELRKSARNSSASAAGSCIRFMPGGGVHQQGQGQRTLRVRRERLHRHHQPPGSRWPVRAARHGAARQPLRRSQLAGRH